MKNIDQQIEAVEAALQLLTPTPENGPLTDVLQTLHFIRAIGPEKVMYAKEMYDILNRCTGSGWLSVLQDRNKFHSDCNDLQNRIFKYKG